MRVLVTGGAGYIGSHAVQALLKAGHTVVSLDNLFRGHREAMDALQPIAQGRLAFVQADLTDRAAIEHTVRSNNVDTVMHFGALAAVGESVDNPLWYYRNNVVGMIALLEVVEAARIPRFVFSSSCAVYGQPPDNLVPIPEDCPKAPLSAYGMTKLHGEHILADCLIAAKRANRDFGYVALRYFNVAGSDHTGVLGEDHDPESHIIPVVIQAALGRREQVAIFGTDYPTPDGTCIRDYVHVEDLAAAHIRAMEWVKPGVGEAFNLGIGKGYSVREIVNAVRVVSKKDFKVVEHPRRAGDPPRLFANPAKIQQQLGWSARFTDLHEIIRTAYTWIQKHPKGYRT